MIVLDPALITALAVFCTGLSSLIWSIRRKAK